MGSKSSLKDEDGEVFTPAPFLIVDTPERLKAFTDPLRNRVLSILAERAATNQQVARALAMPHARTLHHIRALVDAGLIRLVATRIRGGNVEKFYRAEARMFGLRAPVDLTPGIAAAEMEALRQEVTASMAAWPDQGAVFEGRKARLDTARMEEFRRRLLDLIAEFWGGPGRAAVETPAGEALGFYSVMYRDPFDTEGAPTSPSDSPSKSEAGRSRAARRPVSGDHGGGTGPGA